MFFIDDYILKKIENYPRVTLEETLKQIMKSKNKLLAGKYSPAVFDMQYTELKFNSDNLTLYGWYIPIENAKKTIIISHGRSNNRAFCLKFLQLFKDMDLNEKYNIFLPDLRNSGKSPKSKTAFGYYFSRDIKNAILMLNKRFKTKDFVLYGFSQGGIATAMIPYLYKEELEKENINIEKLILDSPISNIAKTIEHHSLFLGFRLPYVLIAYVLAKFNKIIDNNLNKLKLSNLLGIKPTLILQSEKDEVTPYQMICEEYETLKEQNQNNENFIKPDFKAFRKGSHVRMYLLYKSEYTNEIQDFLNKK